MFRLVLLVLVLLACRSARPAEVDRTEFAFGSYLRIRVLAQTPATAESSVARAFGELHRLDTLWSVFLPGSDVARVNRSGRATVAPETRDLVRAALELCVQSRGTLDLTIYPLMEAWGFLDGEPRVPDSAELAAARARVDFHRVSVAGDTVFVRDGARLDLGAFAVGRAVDRAAVVLRDQGASAGLIDAGGDIFVFGDRVWRVGLQDPRGDDIVRVFELRDCAISTSGDYQKFFESDGRRYHHIIDPTTAYPATRCASVTVRAATTLAADAWSTGLFVAGPAGMSDGRLPVGCGAVMLVDVGDSLVVLEAGRLE